MKSKTIRINPRKLYAAQNSQDGLINVADLSMLTGIEVTQLTSFAKVGLLNHYGEYHGKRFYNFEEVVNWANNTDADDVAKIAIRTSLQNELKAKDCPYTFEKASSDGTTTRIKVIWKESFARAA